MHSIVRSEQILSELGLGLDWAAKRHNAIANNIANIDTPKYKRQDVTFPQALARAIKGKNSNLPLKRTNPRHLPAPAAETSIAIVEDKGTTYRNDGNNVDPEVEVAELLKNTLYYDALIDRIGGHVRSLRLVISEGRR